MPLREFVDAHGRDWKVWDTRPETRAEAAAVLGAFHDGWLTFEHEALRRRLVPIPANWETLPDAELSRLCIEASPEMPRRRDHA